ncbi:MAG: FG-GAP repeat protein [Ignavibacteria bacterium]|nr:FG-GAP repeat protein [Ignavibacteria bacterium]
MDDVADFRMSRNGENAYFGVTVSAAGDVNRDGYSDVIVAADGIPSPEDTGILYLYLGGATMDTIADLSMSIGKHQII